MSAAPTRRRAATPLFLRIFLAMLGGVTAVQLCNIALLMLLPPPEPRVFTVEQIAAGLNGTAPRTAFAATRGTEPEGRSTERTHRIEERLAARLGVQPERVRVREEERFFGPPPHRMSEPGPPHEGPIERREELMFGRFTAAVLQADGQWLSVTPVRSGLDFWQSRALIWLIAALVVAAGFAWLLSRRLARPIDAFARAAERLGKDPRGPPVPVEGPPEVAEAAVALNEMQARLSRYVQDRAMMLGAVAHDLRTPLMRLSLRLEGAPEPLRSTIAEDIRDMEAMLTAVLGFVRDLSTPARRQRLDLRALLESVTDGFADQGSAVSLAAGEPVVIEGDVAALKALFANLVGNALAYGGSAAVTLAADAAEAVVEVRDQGPGIPADMLERVFEPFLRLEQSRNRATGGVGLGLASARAVARAHGGDVVLANAPAGGLIARATLPR